MELRKRLERSHGKNFWRSLEELSGDPAFEELIHREFPAFSAEWPEGVSRRRFLQLAGASLALGGLTACTNQPPEKIVPFVDQPENLVPGQPLFFATSLDLDGFAQPVMAESHVGRPTKIEGNPEHPASLGASDLFPQAAILGLYDPDRSQVVKQLGRISSWASFLREAQSTLSALSAFGDLKLRILTEPVSSPTLRRQIDGLLSAHPAARWHQYSPVSQEAVYAGSKIAFGRELQPRYRFDRAQVVIALDSDFLTQGPGSVRYARDFMAARRVHSAQDAEGPRPMNRLYALESSISATGAKADHRLPIPAADFETAVLALAHLLGVPAVADIPAASGLGEAEAAWLEAAAEDLKRHSELSLVVAGDHCSAAVHALAHAINAHLGNLGRTAELHQPNFEIDGLGVDSLRELTSSMQAGEVDVLILAGGNPVFDAPADLDFAAALLKVPNRYRFGLYEDETSAYCQWHIPQAHDLETWGDGLSYDGTITLRQPLIEPLYDGKSALEFFAAMSEDGQKTSREILEASWSEAWGGDSESTEEAVSFEARFRRAIHDGFLVDSAPAAESAVLDPAAVSKAASGIANSVTGESAVVFRPDPTIYDGRFANNGWLQECPKPLTKLTWDNAAIVGPGMAARLGVKNEDKVAVAADGREIELPVWIQPGQPDRTVTVHLGYGRTAAGRVGNGNGADAYRLRSSSHPWIAPGVSVQKREGSIPLASTQLHSNIELEGKEAEKRHLVRTASVEHFRQDPEFAKHLGHSSEEDLSLYPPVEYNGYAWGLSIDLTSCTGCNACVIACQSENNIPVVGKEQVARGREMHWIRVDRYFEGSLDNPKVYHQPVMCMHCEQAPCEVVCPVAATTHSSEGLNEMTYNRCVGTRYCSNNCPYKVRRFNFLLYQDFETPVAKLMRNPDVTVRSRGVMEKCTYCVQRINQARITSEREGRQFRDGEIVTACQQACPTESIVFGNINDAESKVAERKASPLDYGILEELSTRPRTTYMAELRNPNPALDDEPEAHHG
ncbi:MAG: TAT-variant-translocated molybdopterin oxidoreductase [bacterium]|nr:TAT-variant-translocated molybdopterin oxidoreductase [bacterium]